MYEKTHPSFSRTSHPQRAEDKDTNFFNTKHGGISGSAFAPCEISEREIKGLVLRQSLRVLQSLKKNGTFDKIESHSEGYQG
jgi:hypothetical protein